MNVSQINFFNLDSNRQGDSSTHLIYMLFYKQTIYTQIRSVFYPRKWFLCEKRLMFYRRVRARARVSANKLNSRHGRLIQKPHGRSVGMEVGRESVGK